MSDERSASVEFSQGPGSDPQRLARKATLEATLTSAGIAAIAGAGAGFVWGGIGGRVAMRVVFLTSNDRVKGLTSDDGFEIGRISAATIFLLVFTAIGGGIAGFVYGLLRMLLTGPRWLVALGVAVTAAAGIGGGLIVKPEGIDFRLLEPLWLAVGLFLVIPAAWGASVVVFTERLLRPGTIYPTLPANIDKRYGGVVGSATGWLVLAAITTFGFIDLGRDLSALT